MSFIRLPMMVKILVIQVFLLSNLFSVAQARLYRWVDENGNTYYSDKIPPEHSKVKREKLSNNAQVIGITEAAKSKEQWALEKRLEKLKKVQEKLIEKQKSDDRVLLSTFRSEDDLRMTLAGKLRAITAQQKVSQGNLERLENQLQAQQKKAAGYERDGVKIPPEILDEIRLTEEQIQLVILEIDKHIEKKRDVEQEFQADIERFKFLMLKESGSEKSNDNSDKVESDNSMVGLYPCENENECNSAWEAARSFVLSHSTTGIDVDSKKLILSREPNKDNDISLSVSRITKEHQSPQLFLDIRCRNSSQGQELCTSSEVLNLRSAFNLYIKSVMDQP